MAMVARDGLEVPLVLERLRPEVSISFEGSREAQTLAKTLHALPSPFRRILEVHQSGEVVELIQERFVGLSSRQLLDGLHRAHRVLPLDVWLRLAETLGEAFALLPSEAKRFAPTRDCFGVDVTRRLLVFPEPNHSLSPDLSELPIPNESPPIENWSPERLALDPEDECSHVFSLATVLVHLLTGERPYARDDWALDENSIPRWRPSSHPDCSERLGAVLTRAMSLAREDRPQSLSDFRAQLSAAAACAPASFERVAAVVLGVDPESLRRTLNELRAQPSFLPRSWRDGGLDVLEDELLAAILPLEHLPHNRGLLPTPTPAARPSPARKAWWQALWPFGR